ncbi:MAG: type II toxin-antitoxin system VapC family toxin [Ignavibacteriae bacterium]|nr:type II toxin-antitoxin system VapC family toxin [Ignavibacteriota bacterium]
MSNDRFFLDTAYIVALLNPRDEFHRKAEELFSRVESAKEVWITEAVLTEVGNALSRKDRPVAVTFINSCYLTVNLNVVSVDRTLFHRAVKYYDSHRDKDWGLTDCISFVVTKDEDLTDALTSDEHFRQAGFTPLLLNT